MFRKFAIKFLLLLLPLWCYSGNIVRVGFNYDEGIPKSVVVEGEVNENKWLGVSFYPAVFKDAVKNGYHLVREIKKVSFREEFPITIHLAEDYGSSYEIALWGKKVPQEECKIKDCYWCKSRGYHLEVAAFYQTGYFNTLWKEK